MQNLFTVDLFAVVAPARASSSQTSDPFGAAPELESTMVGSVVCQLAPGSHESSLLDHRLQGRYEGVVRWIPALMDSPDYQRLATVGVPLHNLPAGPMRLTV